MSNTPRKGTNAYLRQRVAELANQRAEMYTRIAHVLKDKQTWKTRAVIATSRAEKAERERDLASTARWVDDADYCARIIAALGLSPLSTLGDVADVVELVARDLRVTREKAVGWQHMRTELGTINEQLHERITRLLESNNQLSDRVYGLQAERADLVKAHQQEKDEMTRAHQEKVDYLSAARSVIADTVGAASVDYGDMLEAIRKLQTRAETYQREAAFARKLAGWLCFALVSGVIAIVVQVLG